MLVAGLEFRHITISEKSAYKTLKNPYPTMRFGLARTRKSPMLINLRWAHFDLNPHKGVKPYITLVCVCLYICMM